MNLGQTCMASTLDLETQFFKVLKTPRSTQLQVKCVCQRISQLHKIVTYVPNK